MHELLKLKEALLKSATTIRKQAGEIKSLQEENDGLVKKATFQDPDKIQHVLLDSAKTIRELNSKVSDSDGLRDKLAEADSFKNALEVTAELAGRGVIQWEDLLSKTAELKDNQKLDSIKDTMEFMGGSVDSLFSAELDKTASEGELSGDDAAKSVHDWIMD